MSINALACIAAAYMRLAKAEEQRARCRERLRQGVRAASGVTGAGAAVTRSNYGVKLRRSSEPGRLAAQRRAILCARHRCASVKSREVVGLA